jgi:hypothetical protein
VDEWKTQLQLQLQSRKINGSTSIQFGRAEAELRADDSEFQTRSTGRSGKGCANWQFTAVQSSGEPRTYGPGPRRRGVCSGRGGRFWLARPPAAIWRFGCRRGATRHEYRAEIRMFLENTLGISM